MSKSKKEIKEMLEKLWSDQRKLMKDLSGDENTTLPLVDEYLEEKYSEDEDDEE